MRFIRTTLFYLMLTPLNLSALTAFFNNGEQWEVEDPLQDASSTPQSTGARPALAVINAKEGTIAKILQRSPYEIIIIHKFSEVVGMIWPEPARLTEAQNFIRQGDLARGLTLIDESLKAIEPWPKKPGSWWLKASLMKLVALERLQDTQKLERAINELAKFDDGSRPTLTSSLNLARLTLLNCQGDAKVALQNATTLLARLESPEDIARVHYNQGQSHLLLKNYEAALSVFLRICVFQGTRNEQYPQVLMGIARSLQGLKNPSLKDDKIHASFLYYLRRIIAECPLSAEATIAQTLLQPQPPPRNPNPQPPTCIHRS